VTAPPRTVTASEVRAWLAVAACTLVILLFSGSEFSAGSTSRFFGPLLHWLFPDISPARLLALHLWVRKTAHLTEYAVLGLLAFRALRLSLAIPLGRTALLGLGVVLVVAATDEFHQSFLPSRTGTVVDVAIDFVGGGLGVLLIVALHRAAGIGAPGSETPRG
jgi:VanZ family protein